MTNEEIREKNKEFFCRYPLRSYPKRQILIHAGDDPQHIYYLTDGRIRQYDISYRGDEVVVNIFKPDAFFPMLGALTSLPNKFFFEAETDVKVRLVPMSDTIEYLKDNPDVLLDLTTRLYEGVDGLLGRMVYLMSGNANDRLLYELLIEYRRFGEKAEDGSCMLDINESDIAARAGLSRETVSREMQKLVKEGIVSISHSGIVIPSAKKIMEKLDKGQ